MHVYWVAYRRLLLSTSMWRRHCLRFIASAERSTQGNEEILRPGLHRVRWCALGTYEDTWLLFLVIRHLVFKTKKSKFCHYLSNVKCQTSTVSYSNVCHKKKGTVCILTGDSSPWQLSFGLRHLPATFYNQLIFIKFKYLLLLSIFYP